MQSYRSNFARTGNPNGHGLPEWEPFTESRLAMRLAVDGCAMHDYDKDGKVTIREKELLGEAD